jgi:hypothetical protein
MGVGHGLIRMCRTHVFDAVHATVVPSLLLSQDADHGWSCAGSRLPRLPGAELQGQSHHMLGLTERVGRWQSASSGKTKPLMGVSVGGRARSRLTCLRWAAPAWWCVSNLP